MTRRLLLGGAVAALMFVTLIGLGLWQLDRREQKHALLAAIAAAEGQPPVPLGAQPAAWIRVRAEGRWRADHVALYGSEVREGREGSRIGARVIMALDRDGAPPLLVDRGWVPTPPPPFETPAGVTSVEGYVRQPDHAGWFSAPDDPAARRFFTLDPAAIGPSLGLASVAPFTLVVLGTAPATPDPARALPRPPDDHLNYAFTWFGLAAILLVVFTLAARKRR